MNKNVQDAFLNELQREKKVATIVIVNGFQMKGHLLGHDPYTIQVESDGVQQLVYKHAISTVRWEG